MKLDDPTSSTGHRAAELPFTKMHGIGNDYIYIDAFAQRIEDPAALAVAVSDRHRGIGGDGLILIAPPSDGVAASVRMRMFNADGSESEMCGNGVRCVAKFAIDRGISTDDPLLVETGRGVLEIRWRRGDDGRVDEATVDMGEPILELAKIPVDSRHARPVDDHRHRLGVDGTEIEFVAVSMGNPHAVAFVDELPDAATLRRLGPLVERHPAFPSRVNLHLVRVESRDEVTMVTWERGSGATLACGTGASAVCVAGVLVDATNRSILAHLPGGDLRLSWRREDGHVLMSGPAEEVFSGTWPASASSRPARRSTESSACR